MLRSDVRARRAALAAALVIASTFSLLTPTATALPPTSFTFGAAGDFGNSSDARSTIAATGGAGLDFFIALGDTTYAEASESEWCSFFQGYQPNLLIQAGNHDTGENTGATLTALLAACPYPLAEPLTGVYGREWYFDYPQGAPLARFVMTGCGNSWPQLGEGVWACAAGDPHYNFVANAIDAARNASIPWVIVGTHKNCLSVGEKNCEVGTDLFNMLFQKRVDLILQGHDHVYARSKQLTCAPTNTFAPACVADVGADGTFRKGDGSVLMVVGVGGRPTYTYNVSDAEFGYFAAGWNTTHGFSRFTVNATAIAVDFVRSTGAANQDSFMIEVEPDVVPPVLTVFDPAPGVPIGVPTVLVRGQTEPGATVSVNGLVAAVGPSGSFALQIALPVGPSNITVVARDAAGNEAAVVRAVTYVDPLPALTASLASATAEVASLTGALNASQANLTAALASVAALQASGNATAAELLRAANALAEAEANVTALSDDLATAQAQLSAAQASAAAALARAEGVEANLTVAEADLAAAQVQASSAQARAAQTQDELNATRAELAVTNARLADARAKADAAQAAANAAALSSLIALFVATAAVIAAGWSLRSARRRPPA